MSIDYASIGSRSKFYRTQKKISIIDFAAMVNISRSQISYIERGEKAPSLETFINIANALQISSDELLVDNLDVHNSNRNGDDFYVLLDCSPEEATILVKNMKNLREILRKYTIK